MKNRWICSLQTCIFDTFSQFSTLTKSGLNSRLLDQLSVANKVRQVAEDRKVDRIFFLGDLLNGLSESLSKTVFNSAYYVGKILAECCPTYFLIGNHDVYRRLTVLSNLASVPNLHIMEETETLEDSIDLVPWDGKIPNRKSNTLLGHLAMNGAWVNKDLSSIYYDGTPLDSLVGYQFVFLGHFHSKQALNILGTKEAMYIGSVMQLSFSESPEPRGVILFDGKKSEFVEIDSPKILAFEIKDQNSADLMVEEIKNNKDYYKLIITGKGITLPDFDHRISVEYSVFAEKKARLSEKQNESLQETIERFIGETNTVIDRKKAIQFLREVIE